MWAKNVWISKLSLSSLNSQSIAIVPDITTKALCEKWHKIQFHLESTFHRWICISMSREILSGSTSMAEKGDESSMFTHCMQCIKTVFSCLRLKKWTVFSALSARHSLWCVWACMSVHFTSVYIAFCSPLLCHQHQTNFSYKHFSFYVRKRTYVTVFVSFFSAAEPLFSRFLFFYSIFVVVVAVVCLLHGEFLFSLGRCPVGFQSPIKCFSFFSFRSSLAFPFDRLRVQMPHIFRFP